MVFKEDGDILSWARTCPGRQETQSTAVLWCQDGWGRTLSERQSHPIFVPASSGCRTVNRRLGFPASSPLANRVDGWIFSFPVVDNTAFQSALLKLIGLASPPVLRSHPSSPSQRQRRPRPQIGSVSRKEKEKELHDACMLAFLLHPQRIRCHCGEFKNSTRIHKYESVIEQDELWDGDAQLSGFSVRCDWTTSSARSIYLYLYRYIDR